jgi:hypothetical protein
MNFHLVFRVWQKKRLIVTKDIIAIGQVNDDSETLLDEIPFVDVVSVHDMVGLDEELDTKDLNSSNLHAFLVTTVPDGHNSGRTYYFQTSSADSFSELTRHLLFNAKAARKRADYNTRFTKSQYAMKKLFNSWIFQYFSALLIIMVIRCISVLATQLFCCSCGLHRTSWRVFSRRSTGARWCCRTAHRPSSATSSAT